MINTHFYIEKLMHLLKKKTLCTHTLSLICTVPMLVLMHTSVPMENPTMCLVLHVFRDCWVGVTIGVTVGPFDAVL